jgi:hypothetical protein
MRGKPWSLALALALLAALPAPAQVLKGVMSVQGAEMS